MARAMCQPPPYEPTAHEPTQPSAASDPSDRLNGSIAIGRATSVKAALTR
jgi:hypothetical protein